MKALEQLEEEYPLYEVLSYDPVLPGEARKLVESRNRVAEKIQGIDAELHRTPLLPPPNED